MDRRQRPDRMAGPIAKWGGPRRYPAGHPNGGQFMPSAGGNPGRRKFKLRRPAARSAAEARELGRKTFKDTHGRKRDASTATWKPDPRIKIAVRAARAERAQYRRARRELRHMNSREIARRAGKKVGHATRPSIPKRGFKFVQRQVRNPTVRAAVGGLGATGLAAAAMSSRSRMNGLVLGTGKASAGVPALDGRHLELRFNPQSKKVGVTTRGEAAIARDTKFYHPVAGRVQGDRFGNYYYIPGEKTQAAAVNAGRQAAAAAGRTRVGRAAMIRAATFEHPQPPQIGFADSVAAAHRDAARAEPFAPQRPKRLRLPSNRSSYVNAAGRPVGMSAPRPRRPTMLALPSAAPKARTITIGDPRKAYTTERVGMKQGRRVPLAVPDGTGRHVITIVGGQTARAPIAMDPVPGSMPKPRRPDGILRPIGTQPKGGYRLGSPARSKSKSKRQWTGGVDTLFKGRPARPELIEKHPGHADQSIHGHRPNKGYGRYKPAGTKRGRHAAQLSDSRGRFTTDPAKVRAARMRRARGALAGATLAAGAVGVYQATHPKRPPNTGDATGVIRLDERRARSA